MPRQRYDLKGSTIGRAATEEQKKSPLVVLKDMDIREKQTRFKVGHGRKAAVEFQVSCGLHVSSCIHIQNIEDRGKISGDHGEKAALEHHLSCC